MAVEVGGSRNDGFDETGQHLGMVRDPIAEAPRMVAVTAAEEVDQQDMPRRQRRRLRDMRVFERRRAAQPMNHHEGRAVAYEFEVSQPRATRTEGKELHTIFSSALPGTGKACSITMKGR